MIIQVRWALALGAVVLAASSTMSLAVTATSPSPASRRVISAAVGISPR